MVFYDSFNALDKIFFSIRFLLINLSAFNSMKIQKQVENFEAHRQLLFRLTSIFKR